MQKSSASSTIVHTDIPFRLDRLPWSRFHLLVVIGLGITWILDELEVTIVGSLGPALQSAETLHLSSSNVGAVASFYVVGDRGPGIQLDYGQIRASLRLLRDADRLPYGRATKRVCMGLLEFCLLSDDHRSGHRWRICSGQFRNRRTHPSKISWTD